MEREPPQQNAAGDTLASLVTVAVFPRERFGLTEQCIRSLDAHTPDGVRILYIDGNSPEYLIRRLRNEFPEGRLSVMAAGRYMSPHEAWNMATEAAATRYVAFVENSTLVQPHWLDRLVDCAEATGADVVNPLTLLGHGEEEFIHFSGGHFEVTEGPSGRHFRPVFHDPVDVPYSEDLCRGLTRSQTGFMEPHCFLFRSESRSRFGRFDEAVKSVYEHYDISLTVLEHGGAMYVEPTSVASARSDGDWVASDVPFFHLRWCEEWNRQSLDRFFSKWSYVKDVQYGQAREWLWDHIELIGVKRAMRNSAGDAPTAPQAPVESNLELYRLLSTLGFRDTELKAVREAYEFSASAFSRMFRASGRPFLNHLVGTAGILARDGAAPPMIVAALMHDLYRQGALARTSTPFGSDLRATVGSRFGPDVEAILEQYENIEDLRTKWRGLDPSLCPLSTAKAVVIRIASDLDDCLAGEYAYSSKRPDTVTARDDDYASSVAGFLGFQKTIDRLLEAVPKIETAAPSPTLVSERTTSFRAETDELRIILLVKDLLRTVGRRAGRATKDVAIRRPVRVVSAAFHRVRQSQAWIVPAIIIGKLLTDPGWVTQRVRRRIALAWQGGKAPPHG